MRLIDASALRKSIETDRDASDMPKMWCVGIGYAINHIVHAPTVDAVPVKHGKWNPHPFEKEWDVCSSCGTGCKRREREFNHLGQKSVTEYNYQYCPWCGAKMDERRTDEAD